MADYYVGFDGTVTKNKKKKKQEQQAAYHVSLDGKVTKNAVESTVTKKPSISKLVKETADIAPTWNHGVETKQSSIYDPYASTKSSQKKKEDEEDKGTWFQKGEFEDGYQLGDVSKTILGSVTDAGEHLASGVAGMGEKFIDFVTYLTPTLYANQAMQNGQIVDLETQEKMRKDAEELIKKDLYDEKEIAKAITTKPVKKLTGVDAETASVLGEKSDALIESAGQLGGTAALQAVGVPWWFTTGSTSFGSEAENAFNQGANYTEAGLSATVSAGAEILTEKLSGGIKFGGKTLDDALVKTLANRISDKTMRTLAKVGLDAAGEGTEEVVSSVFSRLGSSLYREENLKELLTSEEALDEYIDSFVGGAVLGGTSSTVQAVKSKMSGKDYVSGLTENEQKVVNKEVENRIAEQEKDGKKLTNKEKNSIKDSVRNDLEKGYISIDTIESALGGDTYNQYKSVSDNEDALKQEFNTLNKMKQGEMTGEQMDRRTELKQQLEELKKTSNRTQLKEQLSKEVSDLTVKDNFLRESYNEKGRRSQTFEADLTKYDSKQQATIQKAIDSGILNNTNRTHEFVDMIAKISADKGVSFDFTNNQRLKESGFARDGVSVNGYIKDGNITLNLNSAKMLNKVVGHEITHVLEGTAHYQELQNAIFEYAKSKNDYDGRLQKLKELYKDVENANVEQELTADLVGDYLFSDEQFVQQLSTQNRNVFQKIYDEIKYLVKTVTSGSKEAKQLEKVKKIFDEVYKESSKGEIKNSVQYSIAELSDGRRYVDVDTDQDLFMGLDESESRHKAREIILERFTGTVIGEKEGQPIVATKRTAKEYAWAMKRSQTPEMAKNKLQASTEIDNLLEASKFKEHKSYEEVQDKHPEAVGGIDYYTTTFKVGDNWYEGTVNILNCKNVRVFYDVTKLKSISGSELPASDSSPAPKTDTSTNSISQNQKKDIEKRKFSITGVNSRTADSSLLLKAEHMLDTGVDSERARQETGWYQGYDGKMRFEIDDSESHLIEEPILQQHTDGEETYFTGKLSDILKHDKLYNAYPELQDMKVIIQETEPGVRGVSFKDSIVLSRDLFQRYTKDYREYLDGGRKAEIEKIEQSPEYKEYDKYYEDTEFQESDPVRWLEEEKKARDKFFSSELGKRYHQLKWGKYNGQKYELGWSKQAQEVLMHEIQHSIQDIEGFSKGSSEGYWQRRINEGHAIRTLEQNKRIQELEDEYSRVANEEKEFFQEMNKLEQMTPDVPRGEIDWETLEQIEEDPIEWQQHDAELERLEEKYGVEKVLGFFDLIYELNNLRIKNLSAGDAYWRTAGEIEARDTANRLKLTAEQRKEKRPNIDSKDVVLREYSLGNDDIAPIGNWNIKGEDIALEEIGPVREDIAPAQESTVVEDIAPLPVRDNQTEQAEDDIAPLTDNIVPFRQRATGTLVPEKYVEVEAITPVHEPKTKRVKHTQSDDDLKQRKFVESATESDVVNREILPKDLDQSKIMYQPISNKVTLDKANARIDAHGYEQSVSDFESKIRDNKVTVEDIVLGERLIQEAMKRGDTETAGELIQNVAILGTELGQKVQALSIINRLTPAGQLKMLQKTVARGKTRGDKAFEGVEITQEMIDYILNTYGENGAYNQEELNEVVEEVKQQIADQMQVTKMEKVNAWRYLSMLGNPKTHIRNIVSNVAMKGTLAVKNATARTIESIAPIENRTKTWQRASDAVKDFAKQTTLEMKDDITGEGKYSNDTSIKAKRDIFKNGVLQKVYDFNSDMLAKEDWWFSKSAFKSSFQEFLTANGIRTEEDIENSAKIVEKGKRYALEQSQIATFRQYSWLASKISDIENKNLATQVVMGSVLPFKKTPINVAKAGLNYSPLGFAKSLTYDIAQVKKGNMEASALVDHLAQNITGTGLAVAGYLLASSGLLNGGGEDDKEGTYDYYLGEQAYSLNIDGNTYSLSWLSPVAMPLFVGANAYEQLVEGKEWNADVVMETLAQTLDPLSEMSFLSSLDDVLSSYDSGVEKFMGMGKSAMQNYVTQFVPTLSSQVAATMDDTKRSTKVSADSGAKMFDEVINQLKYKIPVLRETLEPSTDIWGNEIKQSDNILERGVNNFLAPWSKKEGIATDVDTELKELYGEVGDNGLLPSIPYNYVNFGGEKYKMSAEEHTQFKQTYGQTAKELMEELFATTTYRNANSEEKADMVNRVYDYAGDEAKKEYLTKEGVEYTNATKDGVKYYKEDSIKGAVENDLTIEEFDLYTKNPGKYVVSKAVGGYKLYKTYSSDLYDIKADKDANGKTISGSRKKKVVDYINNLNADYGEKIILFKYQYPSDDTYNKEIVEYLNSRNDISYNEMVTILTELEFTVLEDGTVRW